MFSISCSSSDKSDFNIPASSDLFHYPNGRGWEYRPRRFLPPKPQDSDESTKRLTRDLDRVIGEHPTAIWEEFSTMACMTARLEAISKSSQHHLDFAYGQLRSIMATLAAPGLLSILSAHVRHKKDPPQALLSGLYKAIDSKIDTLNGDQLVEILHGLASLQPPFISDTLLINCYTALASKIDSLKIAQLVSVMQSSEVLAEREKVLVASETLQMFLGEWQEAAASKLLDFSANQLVACLRALSTIGVKPGEVFMERFYAAAASKVGELSESDLTDLLHSLAAFTEPPLLPAPYSFMSALEKSAADKLPSFSAQCLHRLIGSYAKLQRKPSSKLLGRWFACATTEKLDEFSPLQLIEVMESLLTLQVFNETFQQAYAKVLQTKLADVLFNFAKLEEPGAPSAEFMALWEKVTTAALRRLTGQELTNVIQACFVSVSDQTSLSSSTTFWDAFCEAALLKFDEMSVLQLLMVAVPGIAKLRRDSGNRFMQAWYAAAISKAATFTCKELSDAFNVTGMEDWNPPQAYIDTFTAFTFVKLDQFKAAEIAECAEGMANLGLKPSEAFMTRMSARVCQLSFNCKDLLQLLRALDQLKHRCDGALIDKLTTAALAAAEVPGNVEAKHGLELCLELARTSLATPDVRRDCIARLQSNEILHQDSSECSDDVADTDTASDTDSASDTDTDTDILEDRSECSDDVATKKQEEPSDSGAATDAALSPISKTRPRSSHRRPRPTYYGNYTLRPRI